jgi:hypothetical protein
LERSADLTALDAADIDLWALRSLPLPAPTAALALVAAAVAAASCCSATAQPGGRAPASITLTPVAGISSTDSMKGIDATIERSIGSEATRVKTLGLLGRGQPMPQLVMPTTPPR